MRTPELYTAHRVLSNGGLATPEWGFRRYGNGESGAAGMRIPALREWGVPRYGNGESGAAAMGIPAVWSDIPALERDSGTTT
jgi:hypothetical protein